MDKMTRDEALRLAPHYVEILCALRDGTILNQRACEQIAECLETLSRPAPAAGSAEVDPQCKTCGQPRSQHHYRHSFVGPTKDDTIRRQAEEIERLREGLERIACRHVTSAPRWWQVQARAVLNKETGDDDA